MNPTWTLFPGWERPPLSMNDSGKWQAHSDTIHRIRDSAKALAIAANVPVLEHVIVRMIWTVPTRGKRDAENPVKTLKPFCDGLVDAGIVPDDTPDLMTKLMPEIEYRRGVSDVRFELTATTLGESCPLCGSSNPVALCPPPVARQSHELPHPRPIYPERHLDGSDRP